MASAVELISKIPQRPRLFYAPAPGTDEVVVSLITVTHNPQPRLAETVQAVLGQSLQAWEWLIVDDASDDPEALARLAALSEQVLRVRLLRRRERRGLAAARNLGLHEAFGRYVVFLEDNTLLEPTALETLAWYLEVHPELNAVWFGVEHGASAHSRSIPEGWAEITAHPAWQLSIMARRDTVLAVGGFDEAAGQRMEWELWLKLAARLMEKNGRLVLESTRLDASNQFINELREELKQLYPERFQRGIPQSRPAPRAPYAPLPTELPWANRLAKDRPRWLFIIPWMAMGGADRFNLDFLRAWTERGYEMTVVTTIGRNYPWYREFARLTPDIFILPYLLPEHEWPRFLDYLIGSRQYDGVLISNSEAGYPLLPYLRARHPEVAFVDFNHMEEEYWQSGGHPRRAVAYQDVLDLSLVSSQHLKAWMVARGGDPAQIDVVYTNANVERLKPDAALRAAVRARLKLAEDTPVLVYAGRICAQKQPQVFAAVMENLVKAKQRFVCFVLGDGEDMPWLRRYVRKHHLERQVWLLGAVPNETMREYLAAADVFFLPSQMEGISLAIYEAMASGLAVVGADVGGQAELVTPECGVLVKRGTFEEEVAAYTAALLALLRDPQRMRAMGAAGRARVEAHFPLHKMEEQMVAELLERAPALHAARPKPVPSVHWALEHIQVVLYERMLEQTLSERPSCLDAVKNALRPIKDKLWGAGHRVKVVLGLAEE